MEKVVKTLTLMFVTILSVFIVSFISTFLLEVKNECLGPDDDLIAGIYSLVGGTVAFVIGRQIIDE
jgi:membrane protein YqaA with SNARE-associated domain